MERIEPGGLKAGITGARCSLDSCRHTFAKNYLLNGGDNFSLQKILGHSSLASVRIYLNLFASDIKMQYRQFSPVPLVDLFRNHKLEVDFSLSQLKQLFQVFNLPQVSYAV